MSSESDFEKCLKECIHKNEEFLLELDKLKSETNTHHNYCNGIKTVGTVAGATGTTVLVASVMAIPLTGGLSLLGTAGGLALSVGGGATTVITDIVDSYSTKTIIKTIEDLVETKQKLNTDLQKHFDSIEDMKQHLVDNDIPREDSLITILTGIANGSVENLDQVGPSSAVVRLFTNLSRVSHAEELIFQTSHFGLKGLEKVASKVLPALGISGQISGHTLKTLSRFATVFSVAMTVVDIGLLIRDWNSNHPTIVVIDELIAKVNEENQNLNQIYSLIDALKERVFYTIVDQIPIVGATDLFNQIVVQLLNNEAFKCQDILKSNYEINYSFKDLQTPERIASLFTKDCGPAIGLERDEIDSLIKKSGKTSGQSVQDLVKNLLSNLELYKRIDGNNSKGGLNAVPVFNEKVVLVYRQIIDNFVQKTYNCSFGELTRISPDSTVYNDFHNPLSTVIKQNLEEVMIANIPQNICYFNSNAIIYDTIFDNLSQSSVDYMSSLYNSADLSLSIESDKSGIAIKSAIYLLSQYRIYVDEFALQYWLKHNGGNRTLFDESYASVQTVIHNLTDKMRVWVNEIKKYHPNRLYPEL